MASWRDLPTNRHAISDDELNLAATLGCGQAFRWLPDVEDAWLGVVGSRVYKLWREDGNLCWQAYPDGGAEAWQALARYLRLDVRLSHVIEPLAQTDEHLARSLTVARGLRVLAQDPTETICSYVCSAANSVARIAAGISVLSSELGEPIGTLDDITHYTFPNLESLAVMPTSLVDLTGLEFRAFHLRDVALQLLDSPPDWDRLRAVSHEEARSALSGMRWVGMKIADCVCLFALGHDDAVPVDTHVWALARQIFGTEIKTKTLTPTTYRLIDRLFVERYGRWAGWVQEYLYHWRRQILLRSGAIPTSRS